MNVAHQMYEDLLKALEPSLPRTVYQDVRRVRMLAWAITGFEKPCRERWRISQLWI